MSRRANPVAIGAFVLGAVALVVVGLVVFGQVNLFHRPVKVVMYFDESVNGLVVGAPVAYRGVKLGTVTAIKVEVGTTRIAVFAELDPVALSQQTGRENPREMLLKYIRGGLRAQLAMQSIVTGQLYVSLLFVPDTVPASIDEESEVIEIPTVPTLLQQFVDRFERIISAMQNLPWEELFRTGLETLEGARDLARSPELARTLRAADAALADFRKVMASLEREVGPLLASLRNTSEVSRNVVADVGQDLQQLLSDTRPLLSSLRDTSDATRASVTDISRELQTTLSELRPLVNQLEHTATAARALLDKGQAVLADADAALDPDSGLGPQLSQTLQELTEAARSFRGLTTYLERHPEAVLFGRPKPGSR